MKAMEKCILFHLLFVVTEEPHVLQGNTVLHSISRGGETHLSQTTFRLSAVQLTVLFQKSWEEGSAASYSEQPLLDQPAHPRSCSLYFVLGLL